MCPYEELYKLPDISFIGGGTKKLRFNIYNKNGDQAETSTLTGEFTMVNAAHRGSLAVFSAQMQYDEVYPYSLLVEIPASETINLYGKFIYQVTVSGEGFREEPRQGNMYIGLNIDRN